MNTFHAVFALPFLAYLSSTSACRSRWNQAPPLLDFTPSPRAKGSEVIWYRSNDQQNYQYYVDEIDHFLASYSSKNLPHTAQRCTSFRPPDDNKFCVYNLPRYARPCLPEYNYGFSSDVGGPCIFLKLSHLTKNWLPQTYNTTSVPHQMPQFLKDVLRREESRGTHHFVWVSCEGETPADKENIGDLSFFPEAGFPINYLLNNQVEGYLSPFVAVHFERPERGILISVVCTMWAKNIPRDLEDRLGTAHFELMVD